jgi:HK97 family phage portal protein
MKWPSFMSRFRAEGGVPAPSDDYWYNPVGTSTSAGMRITPDAAKQIASVMACVRCISEDVGSLPLFIYRRLQNGGKERASGHPLYDLLHDRPNRWQTAMEFREMLQAHVELRGNGYAQIVSGPRGPVDQLIPLHPDRVRVLPLKNAGEVRYEVKQLDGTKTILLQDEVFHLRGLSSDGITGEGVLTWAKETMGAGLAQQDYANRFWQNGGQPSGVLEHPGRLTDVAAKKLADSFQNRFTGANRHRVAVLEEGMKYNKLGITMLDAQFLEQRKFTRSEIAGLFRVPPHKIGDLEKATFSNIEQQSLDYVISCLQPRLIRWEQAISRDLILAPQVFFAEHLIDGLLRGDIKSRYDAYGSAITNGWITRNEVRLRENLNPIDGLDKPLQPLNMAPSGQQPTVPSNSTNSLEAPAIGGVQ